MDEPQETTGQQDTTARPRWLRDIAESTFLKGLIVGVGIAFAVVAIFSLGVFVGEQKARFSYLWGRNYYRDFGGPPIGLGRPRGFFGGHGAVGVVIDSAVIDKKAGRLTLDGPDNAEKIVLINKDTDVVKGREKIGAKSIKKGDRVVVMGSPDSKGRIKARLIRVFDPEVWKEPMWREEPLRRPLPLPL